MCILCVPLFRFLGSNALIHAMARCGPRRHGSEPSAMEWQREPGHATESRHFATWKYMKIHEAQMKHMADRKPTIAWPSGPILKSRHLHRRISFAKTTLFKQLLVLQETMLAPSKFCMPGWDWKGFFCVCLERAPKQKLFYTFLASYMGLPRISRCQGDFRHISRRQLNGIVWRHLSGSGNEFVTVNFDCDGQGIWPDRDHVCHFETLPKEAFGSMMVQWNPATENDWKCQLDHGCTVPHRGCTVRGGCTASAMARASLMAGRRPGAEALEDRAKRRSSLWNVFDTLLTHLKSFKYI